MFAGCGGGSADGTGVTVGTLLEAGETRSIDGTGNNPSRPTLGAAGAQLSRLTSPTYADHIAAPVSGRPGPRVVSNTIFAEPRVQENSFGLSGLLWQWGQFIDHDIGLTPEAVPPEPLTIAVPSGDPFFDPEDSGTATIAFKRSAYDPLSGTRADNPRQQINAITIFLDGSAIYGSNSSRAAWLRTFSDGRLKTGTDNLLPFNDGSQPNQGGTGTELFVAGDIRANEQIALSAMHTLFVREHNRLTARFAEEHPDWNDETLYQHSRRFLAGLMQSITYNEFLPSLLGDGALTPYRGYDPEVDPSLSNEFSSAVYRFGHSLLPSELWRLGEDGLPVPEGNVPLRSAFFRPDRLLLEGGIDPILRGLASQRAAELDAAVTDEVRNFLFGPPGSGGFDLTSLNMQRGRDHGLPGFNALRLAMGAPAYTSFTELTGNPALATKLEQLYDSVDALDIWVGCLVERRMRGSPVVGETQYLVLQDQFERLRDGDRFWFENDPNFSDAERTEIRETRLSHIILRNTGIRSLQENVFFVE